MSKEQAEGLLLKANDLLLGCMKDMEAGNPVDMSNFEKAIVDFCEVVKTLPKEEALEYQEGLVGLGGALTELSEALERNKDKAEEKLKGLNPSSKAQTAYKKASSYEDSDK